MSLFPKVLWPFSYLTLTQNKPSEFFECYLLFDHYCLTVIDELYIYTPCIPMQINPIKAHWGTGSRPFSSERLATFPTQVDHVLVDLFGGFAGRAPLPHSWTISLMCQLCRFGPQWGHLQEATDECINTWNNKSMFLSQKSTIKKNAASTVSTSSDFLLLSGPSCTSPWVSLHCQSNQKFPGQMVVLCLQNKGQRQSQNFMRLA